MSGEIVRSGGIEFQSDAGGTAGWDVDRELHRVRERKSLAGDRNLLDIHCSQAIVFKRDGGAAEIADGDFAKVYRSGGDSEGAAQAAAANGEAATRNERTGAEGQQEQDYNLEGVGPRIVRENAGPVDI